MAQVLDGHIGEYIVKEPMGSFQKVLTGHHGEYFSQVLTKYPVGKVGVN